MKRIIKALAISAAALCVVVIGTAFTAKKEKKVKHFLVEKEIDVDAKKVWKVVGEDYGSIANSHPKIVSSEYINGSLKAEEGAQRICNFNESGTKYLEEKMVDYDPENMTFKNQVFHADGFPVDPEYTFAIYKVTDLGDGKCKLSFDMTFRTKPAFMGSMMKRSFKGLIKDYFIAIEHNIKTGEKVNADNFKEIKKLYED